MRLGVGLVAAATAALSVSACSSSHDGSAGSLEVRAVIMPAQHAAHVRPNPFGSLHVPASEDAYRTLSRSRQSRLAEALRGVDCAHPPQLSGTAARVVCSADHWVYLVGAPIFTGDDVTSATPLAPSPDNSYQWKIQLFLDSSGADKIYAWTSRHQIESPIGEFGAEQTKRKPPCGASARTPCSDFLAYIVNGKVVAVPPTFDTFRSAVLVTGAFTEASANRLAHKIAG
jgi:hypothetical protein